jgi:predicted RNase H-like nuclease (RuvC/YqgF family)
MTALEIFAILVLAGAVIVLFYYYLKEMNRTGSAGFDTLKSSATNMGKGVSDAGSRVSEGISQQYSSRNAEGEGRMSGVSERVSGMGEMLKGKVKEVPISTDVLSGRIDEFLNDQSDQLIKDWELATKSDVGKLEKKYSKVARDIDDLERRFNEYRGHANKKFEHIEQRLDTLEGKEETETSE